MDEGFAPGLFIGVILSLVVGLFSYASAQSSMREQAIAAQVACWKVADDGKTTFTWHCK